MFTKNITISALIIAVFAVIALAAPVFVSDNFTLENATVAAWGSGSDGGGSGEGSGGDGCGGCGDSPGEGGGDPEPKCWDTAASNYGQVGSCVYPKPSCDSFTADDRTITKGESTTLRWQSTNATKATLLRMWGNQNVPVDGSQRVTPSSNFTFKLTLEGVGGKKVCEIPIVVKEVPAPSCDAFTVSPTLLPYGGGNVTLKWQTSNADSVSISGIGTVKKNNTNGRTELVTQTTNFVLTVKAAGFDDVTCPAKVTVAEEALPTCDFLHADKNTVPYGGGTVKLTWGTTNADSVTLDPGNVSVAKNNNTGRSVNVTSDTVFVITATNAKGSHDCTVPVKVAAPQAPSCDAFTVSPTSLPYGGGNVTLKWETTNADSVSINQGIGAVAADNTTGRTESVTDTTTYTLTASKAGYPDVTCPATVTVGEPKAPKCILFEATPSAHPYGGGTSVLTWKTENADSVSINNDVGVVLANDSLPVAVTQSITYTMTVSAAGYPDATCPAPIAVGDPGLISCENNVTFTANDYTLPRGGGDVVLTWTTTGIDSLSINDVSSTKLNDTEQVNVSSDKTYTLSATANGQTVHCPLKIDVATGGGGGGSSKPRCDLDISDKKIQRGEEITLSWDTSRTNEIRIEDNHGNVLIDSDDNDDMDGKIKIKPTKDTEYTLIAKRGSKKKECEVEVEVENSVTVLETRTHDPRVAGISLTQVPYTGFEAGPALTLLFYTLLTLWGLFVAYVVVIRRDGIGGVSFAGSHDHVTYTDASVPASSTEESSVAEGYVQSAAPVAPTVATTAPENLPIGDPVVGYAALVSDVTEEETDASIEMTELENRAHANHVLMSSDAMRFFMNATPEAKRNEVFDDIVTTAKGTFPTEDGWVVLNLERLEGLLEVTATFTDEAPTPTTAGSLAEAIVTGNVVAAYEMIAHRPMIALADAAADLDAVYRARKGGDTTASDMLTAEAAKLTDEQITTAIAALTGALDGTYDSEENAVKMAIMKAVKAVS